MNRIEQSQFIFGQILLLANRLQTWGDELLEDLTLKQWFLLMMISQTENQEPSLRDIAEYSGTSRQNVRKMLEQLEQKGYVETHRSEKDVRALAMRLTDKSRDFFKAYEIAAADQVNRLFEEVPEEDLDATDRTLERILKALKDLEREAD